MKPNGNNKKNAVTLAQDAVLAGFGLHGIHGFGGLHGLHGLHGIHGIGNHVILQWLGCLQVAAWHCI